jgi:hypothetical protein
MNDFFYSNLIYLKKSSIHGYGIFASEDIKADTIIEKPRYTLIPNTFSNQLNYNQDEIDFIKKTNILDISNYIGYYYPLIDNHVYNLNIIILSICKFINWANKEEDINCEFTFDLNSHYVHLKAVKNIQKDSELLIKRKDGPKTNIN